MTAYIIKLVVLIPVMGGFIFGALWLYRKYQPSLTSSQNERSVRVVDSLNLSGFGKLTVVEFDGKKLLLSVTKNQICKITESELSNE